MDFVFQGFQSDLPIWGYLLLITATTVLAWWSYHSVKSISSPYRYLLIGLRSLTFTILFILLTNPLFKAETTYFEKPRLLVILDNSASTSIEKGDYRGIETYQEVLNELNLSDSSHVNFIHYALDKSIRPSRPESLNFKGDGTNLFRTYDAINNHQREVTAVLLISDGIFTRGRDPVYEAANLDIPLYTIALGDTTQQRDLIVKNVNSNRTGYMETRHPVEVTVENNGFSRQPFEIRLTKGDETLDSHTITPESDLSSHTVNFELELTEEGLQQYNVQIPPNNEEWTKANNSHTFSIDVLDNKQGILSLAFEIHPDVRMIRSLLLRDENTELTSRTWLGGSRFIEGELDLGADSLDLIVLQGYPGNGMPEEVRETVSSLLDDTPSILMFNQSGSVVALEQQTGIVTPVRPEGPAPNAPINLSAALQSDEHPVMELPALNFNRMPSLTAPVQNLKLMQGTVLFTGAFQGQETNQPVITISEIGNLRRTQVMAHGWFRSIQSSREDDRIFTEQLFSNLVSWTAAKPNDKLLDLKPAQTVFTDGQPIELNAFLTNESGASESKADIEVVIMGSEITERSYFMQDTGAGQYQLRLSALPKGIYSYSATARKGDRLIDTQKGEFSVSSSNIEFLNTQRNDRLLRQMALRSGGTFFTYKQADQIWKVLQENKLLVREEKVQETLFYPYQNISWFILIILFLTAEWAIRKYLAMP